MDSSTKTTPLPPGLAILETGVTLDEKNADELMNQVRDLTANGLEYLIFDCTHLEYITSFGLTVFLRTRKILRQKHEDTEEQSTNEIHRVRLATVTPHVLDVLRTARLLEILPIFEDLNAAINHHQ